MRNLMFATMFVAPLAGALSMPAAAQNYPFTPGDYEEVGMIDVSDGGDMNMQPF